MGRFVRRLLIEINANHFECVEIPDDQSVKSRWVVNQHGAMLGEIEFDQDPTDEQVKTEVARRVRQEKW